MFHDNNLIERSLLLNRSEALFRTIRELPDIEKRPRTRDDIRLTTKEITHKFHGRTAKANTNFYI